MTDRIRTKFELSIPNGRLGEFKKLAAKIIQEVDAKQPNTLSYEWYLSEPEGRCHLLITFKDSAAMISHFENISPVAQPLLEFAPVTGVEVYGTPSDEVRQRFSQDQSRDRRRSETRYFTYLNGYTR